MHLGCASSCKTNGGNDLAQFNSCRVHNYKRHGLQSAVLSAEQTLVQTSAFTHRPVSIISRDVMHETISNQENDDDNHVINEDLFLIFMLSNQTRIPCACLVQIVASNEPEKPKYTKLIQYFMRNILNATHHTKHPRHVLPFFSEVPMIQYDAPLN